MPALERARGWEPGTVMGLTMRQFRAYQAHEHGGQIDRMTAAIGGGSGGRESPARGWVSGNGEDKTSVNSAALKRLKARHPNRKSFGLDEVMREAGG